MKFVSESIDDVLKPKSKEEIGKVLPQADPFTLINRDDFDTFPLESKPLIFQIWEDYKNRHPQTVTEKLYGKDLGSFGTSVQFSAYLHGRSLWVVQQTDITSTHGSVMFKISPFKKIRKLKSIILANNYMLENMNQYHQMIEQL